MDLEAIRNANLASAARHLIRAAQSGKTAATMLAEWEKLLPKVPAHQAEIWQPLLCIIQQGAELQSRREIDGTSKWVVPLFIGLVGGAALCWIGVRLMAG